MSLARTLVVALTAATLAGCSSAAERTILDEFFAASRLRDTTALQSLATVSFEPHIQGIITSFAITKVTPASGGGARSEDVSISAPVKLPDGQTLQKAFVITIQRAPRDGSAGPLVVTSIRDASPSTPRS